MGLFVDAVYKDIVEGNHTEEVEIFAEGIVYEVLELGSGVSKSEGHHKEFEETIVALEGRFPFYSILNSEQVGCSA